MKNLFLLFSLLCTAMMTGFLASRYPPSLLLVLMAGIAIFTLSFLNTEWGLCILIFSMLLSPEFTVGTTHGASLGRGVTLRTDDFLLAVIALSWLAKNAFHKELGLFRRTPLNRPIFFYILICAISTAIGIISGRVNGRTGFFFVLKYIEYFLVFFMMINHAEKKEQIRKFVFCLFLTCFVCAIIGIVQIPSGARVSAPFEGEIGEPNTFGGYLLLMGSVAGGIFFTADNLKGKLLFGFLLAAMFLPFLYTQSRSSYLGFIPAFLVLGFLSEKRGFVVALMALILAISPLFLPPAVKNRIFFTFTQPRESGQIRVGGVRIDTSTSDRLRSWGSALKDWTKHPLLGYGVSGYRFLDAQYPRVLTESGLLGMSAFLWLIISLFRMSFGTLAKIKEPYHIGIVKGFIAGNAGLLFHAIGTNTFIIVRIMEPFWFLAGMVAVLPETESADRQGNMPVGKSDP